jgi:hypothetical protein
MLKRIVCVAAVFVAGVVVLADEGRIPLYQPTTITTPGSYVVTNDFGADGVPAIVISASDVSIDLNRHTLRRTGAVGAVITLTGSSAGEHRLTVVNGHLVGGGIDASLWTGGRGPGQGAVLSVSKLVITGGGIMANSPQCWGFDMSDSEVDGAIGLDGDTNNLNLRVLNSRLGSLSVGEMRGGVIRGNTIGSLYIEAGDLGGGQNIVEANVIRGTLTISVPISLTNDATLIRNNLINALVVPTSDNHIIGNSILAGGMTVSGSRNIIEDNSVEHATVSLTLSGDSNLYRNNVFHNSVTAPVIDTGTGNVDAGGNVH